MKLKKLLAGMLVGITALVPLSACGMDNDLKLPDIPDTPGDRDSWLYHEGEFDVDWFVDLSYYSYPNSGKDETSQELKRLTGANITFTSPVDDSGQMLLTMIAGDNLPDVVTLQAGSDTVVKLAKEGYVWPLDVLAEHWAPTLNGRVQDDMRAYFEMDDGHLYCLPGIYYSDDYIDENVKFDSNGGLLVRKDWYEWYVSQPDAKDITKPSGFKDAMLRVKEHFAIPNFTGLLLDEFTGIGNASTIYLSQYFGAPYEDAEGNYLDVMTTPQYSEMLAWVNDLYRSGLIRQSNFTASMDGIGGVISRGEAFATVVAPQNYYYSYVNAYNNNVEYVPLVLTNEAGDTPVIQDLTGNGFLVTMISKKARNIDKIIKLLDFIYSEEGNRLLMFGTEGDMWNWADEEHTQVQYTAKYLQAKKDQELSKYGVNCLTVLMNMAYLEPITSYEGELTEKIYFNNLKRPLRPYCYSYKISWPKLDPSHKDYIDLIRAKTKVDARWSEYLPDIIKSTSADKSTQKFTEAMEAMNRAGREKYMNFYSLSYTQNKQKQGVTWGWPKNDPAYRDPTLRNADGTLSDKPIPATGDPYFLLPITK